MYENIKIADVMEMTIQQAAYCVMYTLKRTIK